MATAASGTMVAFQLAGRATRDALYLSTFPLATLPRMVVVAALFAAVVCIAVSQRMARTGPARIVPLLFGLSALLLLVEWGLGGVSRPLVAVLLYLHFSALGALLISGFWAMVNERFDPRTARRAIARIMLGATLGGLLGGVIPERVGAVLSLRAMFPLLAAFHALSAWLVLGLRPAKAREAGEGAADAAARAAEPVVSARHAFRASPYLRGIVGLVVLTAMAEGLLDFVFKARATAASTNGEGLLRLFAWFYTATALLSILVQTTALRWVLARAGVARSVALLPAGVSAVALGSVFLPGLLPILLARGTEIVLRNSVFRGAYELLFTPVGAGDKRATKLLVDVGASRLGDALGGALIQATLVLAAAAAGQWLLAGVIALAVAALFVARRLQPGYVRALERGLERRAGQLPEIQLEATGSLLLTMGGYEITQVRPRIAARPPAEPATPAAGAPEANPDPEAARRGALESADPAAVRRALAEGPLTPEMTERAIALLAWDEVAPAARAALVGVARRETGRLVAHLVDPAEDFAVRRRLVSVLADCPTAEAFDGLLRALSDRRFEVRYRAGRALAHLRGRDPDRALDAGRVLAVVADEVTVERGVWEGRRLIDDADEPWAPADAELLRRRAGRSMEHVFTLLSLVLPREPLLLAYRGLLTEDPQIRGTALEYLESVLPEPVRKGLWPYLEPSESRRTKPERSAQEVLDNLLASRASILLALERRQQERT